jgi:hypothetical protein
VATNERLEAERARTDELLRAAPPPRIVERLQPGETPIGAGIAVLTTRLT